MSIPQCRLVTGYTAEDGDLILLPYARERKRLFDRSVLPPELRKTEVAPSKRGGARTAPGGPIKGKRVLVRTLRLDAQHVSPASAMRRAVSAALDWGRKEECLRVIVVLDRSPENVVLAAHEGAALGGYGFLRYLSKKEKPPRVLLVVHGKAARRLRRAAARRRILYECINFARDLMNEPPNVLTPPVMADRLRRQGRACGLKMEVWNERRLRAERCGGIIGVGQGAKAKPRLVIGRYGPQGAKKHLCLVGKGVTFDSGGYGLKPADYQVGMKYDMSGAAMMFGASCAIARLKLPLRVTLLTPLAENAVSGEAYHTTSVLTTRSGCTVEVEHTDAEGRLILADALTVAAENKPDWIIDAATLTGAAVVALGEDIAAAFGSDPEFTGKLVKTGLSEDELFWELPLHMPYKEQLKTTIADCKNVGSKYGGSITAALFLKQWVPDKVKWIHCDIAGPAVKEKPLGHLGKGSKGFGIKTVVALAEDLAAS